MTHVDVRVVRVKVVEIGDLAAKMMMESVEALDRGNIAFARSVIAADIALDHLQREVEEPSEVEAWVRAAENMYVPHDEELKIIPQDDNFLDREPWDFRNTPEDHYPLLLFYHPLNIYRKQVIKQADVVLAMFLLGGAFPIEMKKCNFDFYDPLTTGDSSLSSCVEAIIAAQTGDMDKAIRYGMAALLMDLADVGGNVKDGCHIASMGGTWMMLTYGFGGYRTMTGGCPSGPVVRLRTTPFFGSPSRTAARCWKLKSAWRRSNTRCVRANAL